MRTRSRGPASPQPSSPPPAESKPRTKRRATLTQVAVVKVEQPESPKGAANNAESPELCDPNRTNMTPRRANKRVRFSDPGLVMTEAIANASTGLTPSFKRTRLSPNAQRISKKKRRTTLPPRLKLTSTPLPAIQEVQYIPLRQVLDSRMRRRLRRSHLSEEMNSIEEEKRDEEKTQKELEQLRAHGQDSEERIRELMFELESQRQFGIEINVEQESSRKAMAAELQRLRQDLHGPRSGLSSPPRSPVLPERLPIDAPTEVDSDEDLWDDDLNNENSSPTKFNFSSSSPLPTTSSPPGFPSPARTRQLHLQATRQVNDDALRASRDMSEQLETAAREAADAQAALRTLRTDLSRLGFAEEPSAAPDVMIHSIQDAFRRTRLELEHLLPGETASGFENGLLLPAMVDHIRNLLADLHESHRTSASLRQSESALRGQFNSTLAKLADLENRMTVALAQRQEAVVEAKRKDQAVKEMDCAAAAHANIVQDRDSVIEGLELSIRNMQQQLDGAGMRVATLETERAEYSTTIDRLQTALSSYRAEVTSLESLVGNVEKSRTEATEQWTQIQRNAEDLKARNVELETRNKALEASVKETRDFLGHHVVLTKSSIQGSLEEHERAWQCAEDFLKRCDQRSEGVLATA